MKILYTYPVAKRYEHHDYMREIASIDTALSHGSLGGRANLTSTKVRSSVDLHRALLRCAHDIVVIAGHGPTFGLFNAASAEHRRRCAGVFAEQMAACCAPNACVLLMGCSSSWLAPALACRGLRGASFDHPLPSAAIRSFIAAFFDTLCAGRPVELGYEFGCMAMAYDHPDAARGTRWFGPEFDPQRGYHHQWMITPEGLDDVC